MAKVQKKIIEIEITQEACDELNKLQEELFGHYPKEIQDLLGVKKHIPCKLRALYG